MNRKVKRYDPINSDGTCGMCIEDADYGAYVEYEDYVALESENAKLSAGQERPVPQVCMGCVEQASRIRELEHKMDYYTTPQPSAVPACWKLVPVEPTPEMLDAALQDGICVDGKPVWKRDVAFQAKWKYQQMLATAPAHPAAHPDDAAVDRFAAAMKAKLAKAREKGRGGWDDPAQCSVEFLATLLIEHLGKDNAGTFEDVANLAMMLHRRGADPQVLADAAAQDQGEVQRLREAADHEQ